MIARRPGLANEFEAIAYSDAPVLSAEFALTICQQLLVRKVAEDELASLLNNKANRLADLGRREEALAAIEEAVLIHRTLAEGRPEAFLPELAVCPSTIRQPCCLAWVGRRRHTNVRMMPFMFFARFS